VIPRAPADGRVECEVSDTTVPTPSACLSITDSLRPQLPETLDEKWKELMMGTTSRPHE
jgi:hypothetical protein